MADTAGTDSEQTETDGAAEQVDTDGVAEQVDTDGTSERLTADVVVVGAGPAGCVLSLLLARSGVDVVLLEKERTLAREFRGFGFQPAVMKTFAELGVLDAVLDLPHAEVREGVVVVDGERYRLRLPTGEPPYDFALLMEQPALLSLLVDRAVATGNCRFRPATTVTDVRWDGAAAVGVEATDRDAGSDLAVEAPLVVGADGRYSAVRRAAGIDPGREAAGVDLVWFKLGDLPVDAGFRFGPEGALVVVPVSDREVQAGLFVPRGSYGDLVDAGIDAFHDRVASLAPELATAARERVVDFGDCSLLDVAPGMSETWSRNGLLLVGDAAHVASPFGGQGNALAVADAVAAHPVLVRALARDERPVPKTALSAVERERRPAVAEVMRAQVRAERAVSALVTGRLPWSLARPALRVAFGLLGLTVSRRVVSRLATAEPPASVATDLFVDRP